VAFGARTRKVTVRSAWTSGETVPSGAGVCANADPHTRATDRAAILIVWFRLRGIFYRDAATAARGYASKWQYHPKLLRNAGF